MIKVEVLQDHDGEWCIVHVNGEEIYQGHSFREDIFLDYLENKGLITYDHYSLEDREINYGDTSYDKCPKWVQSAYDDHIENLKFEEGF